MSFEIRELDELAVRNNSAELVRLFNYLHSSDDMRLGEWFVWLKAQGHVYGAFKDDKLIGMATALLIPKPYGTPKNFAIQIEDVAVLEEHRKNGVATKLVKHIESVARQKNWGYKISLVCALEKIKFYNKLGYVARFNNMRKDI